nr:transmembrane protein 120B isoform X1 [Microcebus murinus]
MSGPLECCEREWHELEGEFQELQETHRIYRQKLEELSALQTLCSGSIGKQKKRLKDLKHTLQRYKRHASREEAELVQQMATNIKERQNVFFDMEAYLPKKNGLYLNLVLGNVNVTLLSNQAKFAYKDEYEKFKLYLTIILLLGAVACRFVLHYRVTDEVFNFLLVWYYCTLTIRESILISNGSRLRPVPAILLPAGLSLPAAGPGGEESPGPHRGRLPVLDVAGPHLPPALPLLWPLLAALQCCHIIRALHPRGMQRMAGVCAGAHVPHPLPRQLPDHTQSRACQTPEEQKQDKEAMSLGLLCPLGPWTLSHRGVWWHLGHRVPPAAPAAAISGASDIAVGPRPGPRRT